MKQKSEGITLTVTLTHEEYKILRGTLVLAVEMQNSGFNRLTIPERILASAMLKHEREG